MNLAPQPQPNQAPQNMNLGGETPPAPQGAPAPQGQPQLNPQVIEALERKMNEVGPEAQNMVKQALTEFPPLPTVMGIIFGPESEAYFTEIQGMLQKRNSQAPQGAPQNPAQGAPAQAGQPAEATPPAPQLNVGM